MSTSNVIEPGEWITLSILGLIATTLNIRILFKEYTKRQLQDIQFTTKWLRIHSLISHMFGIGYAITWTVDYLPFTCYFSAPLQFTCGTSQLLFIGFYQLSRLYYSFSKSNVYSNKGYRNWVFITMFSIGILILINGCVSSWLVIPYPSHCGINDKAQYYPNMNGYRASKVFLLYIYEIVNFSHFFIFEPVFNFEDIIICRYIVFLIYPL